MANQREDESILDDFTYTGKPSEVASDALRFLCGDTARDPNGSLRDGEVIFLLDRFGVDPDGKPEPYHAVLRAAIEAALKLAAKHAKEASYSIQGVSETANEKAKEYRKVAKDLRKELFLAARPRAGGQSKLGKQRSRQDPDRIQPAFRRDMFS